MEKCEKRASYSHTNTLPARLTSVTAVIAVLHGISYGLALDIVLAADIRVCAASTRFAVKEVDIGLAADIGTLSRLPRAGVSMSWAKEVCLSARDFDAKEALAVGLVSRVCEDKAAALKHGLELASTIAAKSPVAVVGTKHVLNYSRDHSIADGECIELRSLDRSGGSYA